MTAVQALAETAESLRRAAYDAGYQIRWVAPATYHITLKFLGWMQPELITPICDRLSPRLSHIPGFEFTATGLGAFPSVENARVIWAGVDDPEGHLTGLAGAIEEELAALGVAADRRPFHPHVTLGRVKRVDDLSSLLSGVAEQKFRSTRVRRVVLFESLINSIGSEYGVRADWALLSRRKDAKRHTEGLKESAAEGTIEADRIDRGPEPDSAAAAAPTPLSKSTEIASPSEHAVQVSQDRQPE